MPRRPLADCLERWIQETGDLGGVFEPDELARNQGVTRPGTPSLKGYTPEDRATPKPVKP